MSQDNEHKKRKPIRDEIDELKVKTDRVYNVVLKGDKDQGIPSLLERQQGDEKFQEIVIEEFKGLKDLVIKKNDEVKNEVKEDREIVIQKLAEQSVTHDRVKSGVLKSFSFKTLITFFFVFCFILALQVLGLVELLERISMKYLGI